MNCRPLRLRRRGACSNGNRPGRSRPRHGFSLIELLITTGIILVLVTMYWGGNSATRQKSRQAVCRQNLQKVYLGIEIFGNEHQGKYPDKPGARTAAEALDVLVPRYTADTSGFICPGGKDSPLPGGESIAKRKISYAYYMGRSSGNSQDALLTDRQVDTKSKVVNQQIFSITGKPPGNNHKQYGGNILFCDGHAEASPPNSAFSLVLTQGVVLLNP
jgi:prepilin-type N-terminal cleavage/methylation domain-containing protein/prepilin-type processing-associated H-X9-DG protein